MSLTVSLSLNQLNHSLKALTQQPDTQVVALVADLFSADALDIGKEFNLPSYIHFPSSAVNLSIVLHMPNLDKDDTWHWSPTEPLQLPGCFPILGKDLPDLFQDKTSDYYKSFLEIAKKICQAEGIIINTFLDLEPNVVQILQNENHKPPVYAVGPNIQTETSIRGINTTKPDSHILEWLDKQPENSVLYVSFGSGASLSHEQITELALGLEKSEHRFIWVVRPPTGGSASSTYLTAQKDANDPLVHLPDGFLDRTKNQGLVVPGWAPQIEILKHVSTGGFLTHCGWNSTLESVVYGKPMIAWPLFADQTVTAVMVSEAIKVAVKPAARESDGVIESGEVARVVKVLLGSEEGKEMGKRILEYKEAAVKAYENGGSSLKTLDSLALKWKNY